MKYLEMPEDYKKEPEEELKEVEVEIEDWKKAWKYRTLSWFRMRRLRRKAKDIVHTEKPKKVEENEGKINADSSC